MVKTFDQLPVPLSQAFAPSTSEKTVDVRAVVLDKDNCFAAPHSNTIHPSNTETFSALLKEYSADNLLIVSNSSGLASKDPSGAQAEELEFNTGVTVLRHQHRKPSQACQAEILAHFRKRGVVTKPSQICVVGDRLLTDVVMANMMGARSIWVRNGVVKDLGLFTRFEYGLSDSLLRRGWKAPEVSP